MVGFIHLEMVATSVADLSLYYIPSNSVFPWNIMTYFLGALSASLVALHRFYEYHRYEYHMNTIDRLMVLH